MSVDSETVSRRRNLHLNVLDEVVADAAMLVASARLKTLDNWPLSKFLMHLALAMNGSLDGVTFKASWRNRLLGRFVKRRMLRDGLPPGIRLPSEVESNAFPPAASPAEAFDVLQRAANRLRHERATATHHFLENSRTKNGLNCACGMPKCI